METLKECSNPIRKRNKSKQIQRDRHQDSQNNVQQITLMT